MFFSFRHDVSWGTKGSDKAEALPQLKSSKPTGDAPAMVTDVVKEQADVEATFKETVARAVAKPAKTKGEVEKPTMDVCIEAFTLLPDCGRS